MDMQTIVTLMCGFMFLFGFFAYREGIKAFERSQEVYRRASEFYRLSDKLWTLQADGDPDELEATLTQLEELS